MEGDGKPATTVDKELLKIGETIEDTIDVELQRLDQPDELERIRQKRLQEFKLRGAQQSAWKMKGHGEYQELRAEKEFFAVAKESESVVCHFYRDNRPCKVLDEHLSLLAKSHIETKFVRLNAEKSPYLTEKLKIRVLPTLALLRHGKVVDYVVGFDELGGQESFPTPLLEARLARAEVLETPEGAACGIASEARIVRKGGLFE